MSNYTIGQEQGAPTILQDGKPMSAQDIVNKLSNHDSQVALVEKMRHIARESQDWNWLIAKEEADDQDSETLSIDAMQSLVEAVETSPEIALAELKASTLRQLRFPTMLRKMWSGGEVQQWLCDEADRMLMETDEQDSA